MMIWGDCLSEKQALELRTLAKVFDLDFEPEAPLPRLWTALRPLIDDIEGASD